MSSTDRPTPVLPHHGQALRGAALPVLPVLCEDILDSFGNHVLVAEADGTFAHVNLRAGWCRHLWSVETVSPDGERGSPCRTFARELALECSRRGETVERRCPAGLLVLGCPVPTGGGPAGAILGSACTDALAPDETARRYHIDPESLSDELLPAVDGDEVLPRLARRLASVARVVGLLVELDQARRDIDALSLYPASNPNPVLRLDRAGTLLYANAAATPVVESLWVGDGGLAAEWLEVSSRALEEGQIIRRELVRETERYDLAFAPIAEEGLVNVYGLDVTERHRAERERLRLEKQVQHTQKLESLGVLAGGIAHDFNNLLVGILGNADLALEELPPTSLARPYLDDILTASKRAADLCRQMLAYSGKGRFVVEALDLNEIIEEMGHLLEVSISKKAIIKLELEPNLPPVEGDATQMRQLVMNLVTNASEAIGDRSGLIRIRTGATDCASEYIDLSVSDETVRPGPYVFVEISDTGCGMDEATQKRIFEPFFTTKFTGRGLGLAALLGIVRGHHGLIRVYSEPGQGTTMKILFPVAERPHGAMRPRTSEDDEAFRGSGTVLLVDDEETVRAVGRRMLENAGFAVHCCRDGREALDYHRSHAAEIRLVVLDLTMPHLDGEETLRALHQTDSEIPILLSSGYNEQDVIARFAGRRFAGFIQKPYRQGEFLRCIREILSGAKKGGEPEGQKEKEQEQEEKKSE